jgi:hypothetical protein
MRPTAGERWGVASLVVLAVLMAARPQGRPAGDPAPSRWTPLRRAAVAAARLIPSDRPERPAALAASAIARRDRNFG